MHSSSPPISFMTSEKAYTVAANPFLLGILLIRAGIEINPGPYDSLIREFVLAAADGNLAAIRSLLRRDPSLATIKAQNANSALYAAAYNGHTTVVKELWKHGADIDEKGPDGTTPLLVAIARGYTATAEYLIKQGALLVSRDGHTPLMVAVDNGDEA